MSAVTTFSISAATTLRVTEFVIVENSLVEDSLSEDMLDPASVPTALFRQLRIQALPGRCRTKAAEAAAR